MTILFRIVIAAIVVVLIAFAVSYMGGNEPQSVEEAVNEAAESTGQYFEDAADQVERSLN